MSSFAEKFSIKYPLIQAPMAGGATTAELVAAVSNYGALGSLAAGMLSPDILEDEILNIQNLTDKPFAVNLMVLSKKDSETLDHDMPKWLKQYYIENSIEVTLPKHPAPFFHEQLDVLFDNPVKVVSFTFGIVDKPLINDFHSIGTLVVGTANHFEEALLWQQLGADAVTLQGAEAGGHRGGWLDVSKSNYQSIKELLSNCVEEISIPLIAAGGIATSYHIKDIMKLGADAVQVGTPFLTTNESGASNIYKKGLLQAAKEDPPRPTKHTHLFSGKAGRGLQNDYMKEYLEYDVSDNLPPYPQLNAMTHQMRHSATLSNDLEYLSLWAGIHYTEVRQESVKQLLDRLTAAFDS